MYFIGGQVLADIETKSKRNLMKSFSVTQTFDFEYLPRTNPQINRKYFSLAKSLCPQLYVDPKIFAIERAIIARNLKINGIRCNPLIWLREIFRRRNIEAMANALLSFYFFYDSKIVSFPEKIRKPDFGVGLWILTHADEILAKFNLFLSTDEVEDLLEEMKNQLLKIKPSRKKMRKLIKDYFLEAFPEHPLTNTCAIKYNVVKHHDHPSLFCIEYFFFWPIQVWPHHIFDYEPVYVYAYNTKPNPTIIAVSYNSVSDRKALIKTFLSLFRKRPGHNLKIFFNPRSSRNSSWATSPEKEKWFFERYNQFGKYMTEAYSGQYVYESNINKIDNNLSKVLENGRVTLCIPNVLGIPLLWHAFDTISKETKAKKQKLDCLLMPLEGHDLLHIEWNIKDPFQVPFLYPLLGNKDYNYMHLPVDMIDIIEGKHTPGQIGYPYYDTERWHRFCDKPHNYDLNPGNSWDEINYIYRLRKLIELLFYLQKKEFPRDLQRRIKFGVKNRLQELREWVER
jgi:hypothetical protein